MTGEQMATLQPALRRHLEAFRDCFRKEVTFGYLETYVVGLMSDLKRKSIEPIALAAEVPVRTLQEFLSSFRWDHGRAERQLHQMVADRHGGENAIGVIDGSGITSRATRRRGCSGNGAARRARSTTAWWASTCCTPTTTRTIPSGAFCAATCSCPRAGRPTRSVARKRRFPSNFTIGPSGRLPWSRLPGPWATACGSRTWSLTRIMGAFRASGSALDALGQRGIGEARSNFLCWATEPVVPLSSGRALPRTRCGICWGIVRCSIARRGRK